MESSRIRLAADVGGTFTDVAAFDETTGELRLGKTLTTPARLVTGVEKGVTKAGARFSGARLFLHGTTVAINTILQESGSKVGLITTLGFRDCLEITRGSRREIYNLFYRNPTPLVPRRLRRAFRMWNSSAICSKRGTRSRYLLNSADGRSMRMAFTSV